MAAENILEVLRNSSLKKAEKIQAVIRHFNITNVILDFDYAKAIKEGSVEKLVLIERIREKTNNDVCQILGQEELHL